MIALAAAVRAPTTIRRRLGALAAGAVLLVALGPLGTTACRRGVPVVDVAPKPVVANGTLSGRVTGPEGTSAVDGRAVEVVNVDTGVRQRVVTNKAGGFTFKLPPGKYRVELTLHDGESILKQPGVIDLSRSDVDAHADFVVGSARISRPQNGPRGQDGLGAPLA